MIIIKKNKIILHIDMNSYFASVEQQANPFLRGKSVGVCAYLSPGGVIIASSIEAKSRGIKTGCKVGEAKFLDPNVVLLENEPAKYRSTTEKIFNIFKEYSDRVEPYSIDEAFVDLTGWVKDFGEAKVVAKKIKSRIEKEVGEWLGCSIGISWTKFLAKFAGDIAPKRSILIINSENKLNKILDKRPLKDAWGINDRMEARLLAIGINDLFELKKYDSNRIRMVMGKYGYYLWCNVNGIEITNINQGSRRPKSVGHSYSLPQRNADKEQLKKILFKLCEKTGRRLRNMESEAESIHLGLTRIESGGFFRSRKTPEKMFTTEEIYENAKKILNEANLFPVRVLNVSVSSLVPISNQMSLFENNLNIKKLSKALDKINDKYGEYTVVKGRIFDADNIARDRIGFRKTMEI